MSCECGSKSTKLYYSNVQLFSQPDESGIPSRVGIPLTKTQVRVCTQCGKAEFDVPELDMHRWFGKQPYQLGVGS
jgi:hypothetical protein